MIRYIRRGATKDSIDTYFNTLAAVGFTNRDTVKRLLLWIFVTDFYAVICDWLTQDDINKIDKFLSCLFSGGDCTFPHMSSDVVLASIKKPENTTFKLRISEDGIFKLTENNKPRRV